MRQHARGRFEHRGLAGAGRAHQVDRDDAGGAKVLAVVRRRPVVAGEDSSRAGRPARARGRRSRRNRTSRHLHFDPIEDDFVAADQAGRAVTARGIAAAGPVRSARRIARTPSCTGTISTSSSARSQMVRSRNVMNAVRNSSTSTPDMLADAHAEPVHRGGVARARFGFDALDQRLNQRVLVHGHRLAKCGARFSKKLSSPSANSAPSAMRLR